MKHYEIAKKADVSKAYVSKILSGKTKPDTPTGIRVLMIAAEIQAEFFKAEYISSYLRNWKLKETIKNRKNGLSK